MADQSTRREFLRRTTLAGAGVWVGSRDAWAASRSANERLNVACIGVWNRGHDDLEGVLSENIVAICDVDEGNLRRAAEKYPKAAKAEKYTDWRKLLERDDVDAVTIAVPDHVHAVAAKAAIELGKHVYCEKPLTHSI